VITLEQYKQLYRESRANGTALDIFAIAKEYGMEPRNVRDLDEIATHEVAKELAVPQIAVMEPEPVIEVNTEEIRDGEAQSEIRSLEIANKELMDALPDSADITLPEVPDNPVEKLQALKQTNSILTDAVNAESVPKDQPKYGKFDGPTIMIPAKLIGKDKPAFVDIDGTDIYDGTKYKLTPWMLEQLDEAAKEKADDFLAAYEKGVEPHLRYAMTQAEYEQEIEKKHPILPMPKQPGPAWDDSILYGDAGRFIKKLSQYSESHPAGMLVDFLISIGSIIGRGPYFTVNSTRHYTNEFMIRVGDSSKSRKGSGRDAIDAILKLVDYEWFSNRILSGFGSGEAVIDNVRDAHVEQRMVKGKFESIVVPGVPDKRLCIREGEAAKILVLANKPESHADSIIRDAWDGKILRNVVKGKTKDGLSNSAKCEEPHISISADTTAEEFKAKMPTGAQDNGFGNRFLYVHVYRIKDCPHSGPEMDWSEEIAAFQQVVQFARTIKYVPMSASARNWWAKKYTKFEHDGPTGLAGKMTARASAHVHRLAMIYALIDLSDQIELEHFQAAEKLWDYCSESALFIFSGVTKEQQKILQWISSRGPATFNQIYAELYHKHRLVGSIRSDLKYLVERHQLAVRNDVYASQEHAGRLAA